MNNETIKTIITEIKEVKKERNKNNAIEFKFNNIEELAANIDNFYIRNILNYWVEKNSMEELEKLTTNKYRVIHFNHFNYVSIEPLNAIRKKYPEFRKMKSKELYKAIKDNNNITMELLNNIIEEDNNFNLNIYNLEEETAEHFKINILGVQQINKEKKYLIKFNINYRENREKETELSYIFRERAKR